MKNNHNTVTGTIGKTMKYFGLLYFIFLLSSCASFPSQESLNMLIALERINTINTQPEISAYDLHKILTSRFGHVRIKLSDTVYTLPDNDKVVQLLQPAYDPSYVCNQVGEFNWGRTDFAIASMVLLRNYAFGTMFVTASDGDQYVINVFVNNRKEIVLWDPQKSEHYQGQVDVPELILI